MTDSTSSVEEGADLVLPTRDLSERRSLFASIDPQLFLITARNGDRESGMIATWVMSATLLDDRARVIVAMSPRGLTAELIGASKRFVLHLLAEGQHELVPHFGLESGRDHDKLAALEAAGIHVSRVPCGLAVIRGVAGFAECEVLERIDVADRAIFVAGIVAEEVDETCVPLTLGAAYRALPPDVADACEEQRRQDGLRDAELDLSYCLH